MDFSEPTGVQVAEYLKAGIKDPKELLDAQDWGVDEKKRWTAAFNRNLKPAIGLLHEGEKKQRAKDDAFRADFASRPPILRDVVEGLRGSAVGLGKTAARLLPDDDPFGNVSDRLDQSEIERSNLIGQIDGTSGPYMGLAQETTRGVFNSVGTMVALSPGGPAAVAGGFMAGEASSALSEGRRKGLKGGELWHFVGSAAAIEGGIMTGFQLAGVGGAEKLLLGGPVSRNAMREVTKQLGWELAEENLTELLHAYNKEKAGVEGPLTFEKAGNIMAQTSLNTVGVTAMVGGGQSARGRSQRKKIAAGLAEKYGWTPSQARGAVDRASERKGDFARNLGQEVTDEHALSWEGLGGWVINNEAKARALVGSGKKASRTDFEKAGLPKGRKGPERAEVQQRVAELLDHVDDPLAQESVQEAPAEEGVDLEAAVAEFMQEPEEQAAPEEQAVGLEDSEAEILSFLEEEEDGGQVEPFTIDEEGSPEAQAEPDLLTSEERADLADKPKSKGLKIRVTEKPDPRPEIKDGVVAPAVESKAKAPDPGKIKALKKKVAAQIASEDAAKNLGLKKEAQAKKDAEKAAKKEKKAAAKRAKAEAKEAAKEKKEPGATAEESLSEDLFKRMAKDKALWTEGNLSALRVEQLQQLEKRLGTLPDDGETAGLKERLAGTLKLRKALNRPKRKTSVEAVDLQDARAQAGDRPFRAPHYTAPPKAMADEVKLAEGGVLYLPDLAEFSKRSVEMVAHSLKGSDVELVVGPRPDHAFAAARWDKHMAALGRESQEGLAEEAPKPAPRKKIKGKAKPKRKAKKKPRTGVNTKVVRSKKNPDFVKVEFDGKVGRIEFKGESRGIHLGLHKPGEITFREIDAVVSGTMNRLEGGKVPPGTRRKIEKAVLEAVQAAHAEKPTQGGLFGVDGFSDDTGATPTRGAMSVTYNGPGTPAEASTMNVGELNRLLKQAGGSTAKVLPEFRGKGVVGQFRGDKGIGLRADIFIGPVVVTGIAEDADVARIQQELIDGILTAYPSLGVDDLKVKIEAVKKRRGVQRITIYQIDSDFAAKVLAHEIGHWVDFQKGQEETMSRGNILGRLASLKGYLKHTFGAVQKAEVRSELKALTMWWNPFNEANNANYTKYRYSSRELYAEALSVLLNNPTALRGRAPIFYQTFFQQLHKKPKVEAAYKKLVQEVVSGTSAEALLNDFYEGMARGEQEIKKAAEAGEDVNRLDEVGDALMDRQWSLYRVLARARKKGMTVADPRRIIDTAKYTGSVVEEYRIQNNAIAIDLEAGNLTPQDFGTYLLFKRAESPDSDHKAVPVFGDQKTAAKSLSEFKKTMGPAKMAIMEKARKDFRKARESLVLDKVASTRVYGQEFTDFLLNNDSYARHEVVDYIDRRGGGEGSGLNMFERLGTLQEVANPWSSTMAADISLMWATNWNHAKGASAKALLAAGSATKAEMKWNGKTRAPAAPSDPKLGLISYMEDGHVEGVYVPAIVARGLSAPNATVRSMSSVLRIVSHPTRMWFTNLRPGFQVFNVFFRDPVRTMTNTKAGKRPFALYKELFKSLKAAGLEELQGVPDPVLSEMRSRGLIITFSGAENVDEGATSIDRFLSRNLDSKKWDNNVRNPFRRWYARMLLMGNRVLLAGEIGERANKRAGYVFLKENQVALGMSDEDIDHAVRHYVGSPSFITGGSLTPITNNIFLFSNAAKEGWRSDIAAFREDPAGVAARRLAYNVMPKVVMFAFASGLMTAAIRALGGDDDNPLLEWATVQEQIFARVSSYDMANYHIIPITMLDSGKAVYLRIPTDETGRVIGGAIVTLLTGEDAAKGLQDALTYMGDQGPGTLPTYSLVEEVLAYIGGSNPYDSFRGRSAVRDRVFEAGGAESHKEFGKWLWNRYGGKFLYQFDSDNPLDEKSQLEEILRLPVFSDVGGRFIKVSDHGLYQKAKKARDKARAERTRGELKLEKAVKKGLRGERLTSEEGKRLKSHPRAAESKRKSLEVRGGQSLDRSLHGAKSYEEQKAVLDFFRGVENTPAVKKATSELHGKLIYEASRDRPKAAGAVPQWETDVKRARAVLGDIGLSQALEALEGERLRKEVQRKGMRLTPANRRAALRTSKRPKGGGRPKKTPYGERVARLRKLYR